MPKYDITKFNVHEIKLPDGGEAMAADVAISAFNKYPVKFNVPQLGFEILVPGCTAEDGFIVFANATNNVIHVGPHQQVSAKARGVVRQLPDVLTTACPDTKTSPLDALLKDYMQGNDTTIFVRGAHSPSPDTPEWISELMQNVIVPVPFPGHSFDGLIREFALDKVHFGLPDPFADPDTPDSQPKISATIKALVNLPKEMNFDIDVTRIRAKADIYYKQKKLGYLDLHKWQKASSSRIEAHNATGPGLLIESAIDRAPLNITDSDVFSDVVEKIIFGDEPIILEAKALVDVETQTVLGRFVVRDLPAAGKVPVKR
jgi:hypothetical protein